MRVLTIHPGGLMGESGASRSKPARRVLVVVDSPIVRQGLRRVMEYEDDLTVCGEAETVSDAQAAIRELNPDLLITDISFHQGDGIELVRDVRTEYPRLPILVLSVHDESVYAERMLLAGAEGLHHDGRREPTSFSSLCDDCSTAVSMCRKPSATI